MRLLFYLALRALFRNRLALSLLVVAVTVGVGLQIPNSANLNGYSAELLRQGMSRSTGHVQVSARGAEGLDQAEGLTQRLRRFPFVRAVAVRLTHGGVLFKRGEHYPVRVVGIDMAAEQAATRFCDRLAQGRCVDASADAGREKTEAVVLGHGLAQEMRIRAGERVKLVIPYENLGEVEYSSAWYSVVGVLEGGGDFSADRDCFLSLGHLRRILGQKDAATSLLLYVDDPSRSGIYAAALQPHLGRAQARPWWEVNELVASAIAGNRAIAAVSMTMVIFAVMIPVSALLYIMVLHERRQIAVLAALGFGRAALFALYLMKALLIGLVGSALGIGVGALVCRYFTAHPIFAHNGFVVRPELSLATVALPSLTLMGVTLLAGLVPAVLAARSNPSVELRED